MYKIFETDQFLKDLDKNVQIRHIRKKLESQVYTRLRNNPCYGANIKKLRGYQPDTWRYRIADYRFFYEIDLKEKIVYMITADHRKDCY